jgi:hypothetical protein
MKLNPEEFEAEYKVIGIRALEYDIRQIEKGDRDDEMIARM